ncbi:gasdermin-D-like [Meriones unguiculatus]|uniref:gasdermin-D-like n=1 Tax=Meriones unguiculatus TaxID=10047 RepID=UPI000B4F4213|nr:gasdermin-D-like [Meriones unguiculatus]
MSSAFVSVVRSVIKEVDQRGELIRVDSLRNSTSIRPYCLLSRKPSTSWFWKPRYTCVNLSIKDILEPSAPEPEPECRGRFHFSDVVDRNVQGSVGLSGTGQGKISGGAAVSHSSSASVNVHLLRVAQNTWEMLQHERHLRQPEHKILQELRNRRHNVFVVTEVLQTQEEMQVTRTHNRKGSGQFAVLGAISLQGEGQGHRNQKKMVTIPAGSILAFQVAQLLIDPKWDILLLPDENERTFELPSSGHRKSYRMDVALQPICEQLKAGLDGYQVRSLTMNDFRGLCAEVKAASTRLEYFDMELRQELLVNIGKILQDQPSMEALEAVLEQGLYSGKKVEPLDGPAGSILECLVLSSGTLVMEVAAPVFYLLEALAVLSETQQQLLAMSLEATVLSKQLELVKHILEWTTPWHKQSCVSLPLRLLGDSWDEEAPTWVLLEECGLRLQVNTPQVHWEPVSQDPMCALYTCLALLLTLSQNLASLQGSLPLTSSFTVL